MARHRDPASSTRRRVIAGVVGAALVFGVLTAIRFAREEPTPVSQDCAADPVVVATSPDALAVVESVAPGLEDGTACVLIEAVSADPAEVSRGEGPDADLWIPDSMLWLSDTAALGEVSVVTPSLASSPLTLPGVGEPPASWVQALTEVGVPDATVSAIGAGALLAVQAERDQTGAGDEEVGAALLAAAQDPDPADDVVSSERADLAADADGRTPATGTPFLDYPLVALSTDPGTQAAAEALTSALQTDVGVEALHDAFLRTPDRAPLPEDAGVGDVPALELPADASVLEQTLGTLDALRVPSRLLAVVDVSGSMDELAGEASRIELTVAAATQGLALFPDTAAIGAWAFSDEELTDDGTPYDELVPIRSLSASADGSPQRDLVASALSGLPAITDNGTALFDTVVGAYRFVQESYDPDAVNSVLLLTDGADDGSSLLSEEEAIAALAAEADPERPVQLILIGISEDADVEALERLAAPVEGRVFTAVDPADIGEVFLRSFLARAGGG